ncbi:MAG: TAXI family TRAP transporter solute-binding subunit [Gammaproteobacteria bacterium]
MSRYARIGLIAGLWLALLGGLTFWFGGREVVQLSIVPGPSNGEAYELAIAISRVTDASDLNLDIEVYETQGSGENIRLVDTGQVDLAIIQSDAEVTQDVRAIAPLFSDAYQLVATKESGIRSVADLSGHRIAIPPEGSGQNQSFWFLMDHYGLDDSEFTALAMADEAANFAMRQGQVDAVFRVRAPGNRLVRELVRDQANMRLIPVDQPQALSLLRPMISTGSIPRGSYRGSPALPADELETAVVERLLIARKDLDEEIVYRLTQLLFEQRSALVAQSNLAGFIRPLGADDRISIPLHEGARRYYDREKPSVIQENSRLAATMLYVCALLTSVFVALRSRVKHAHRVRVSKYNVELMDIAQQARTADATTDLSPLRERLVEILQEVVLDLDAERVTKDEFDHFSFTWQAVDTLLRDQLRRSVTA